MLTTTPFLPSQMACSRCFSILLFISPSFSLRFGGDTGTVQEPHQHAYDPSVPPLLFLHAILSSFLSLFSLPVVLSFDPSSFSISVQCVERYSGEEKQTDVVYCLLLFFFFSFMFPCVDVGYVSFPWGLAV